MKEAETGLEEKKVTESPRDAETELLIIEYQKNNNLDPTTLKVLEYFGVEEWREDKEIDMRKCIQRLVEDELVQQYQRNSRPDKETREALESCEGTAWREDKGE